MPLATKRPVNVNQDTNITTLPAAIAKHLQEGFRMVLTPALINGELDPNPPAVLDFWHRDEDTKEVTEARFYLATAIGTDRARRFYYARAQDEGFVDEIPQALKHFSWDFAAFGYEQNRIVTVRHPSEATVNGRKNVVEIAKACDANGFVFYFYQAG